MFKIKCRGLITMFRKCLFFVFLVPLISSCYGMVGGACTYETVYGTARIIALEDGKVLAQFDAENHYAIDNSVLMARLLKFHVKQPVAAGVGSLYPAEMSVITKGSCSPGKVRLLATEEYRSDTFVPFDQDGRLTVEAERKLGQIARVFKKLENKWPQLQLAICGQTSSTGTQEYNLALGDQYAHRVANKLQEHGVPISLISTFSAGEDTCSRTALFDKSEAHGVCIDFSLVDTQTDIIEE